MAIVMETTLAEANEESAAYDKFQTTKNDAETLLKRNDSYMDVSCSQFGYKFMKIYRKFFLFLCRWKTKMVISSICHRKRSAHC